jgi:hypothetical protein
MGAWQSTYTDLVRTRFSALVAYAVLLEDDAALARESAQDATTFVFSRARLPRGVGAAEVACRERMRSQALTRGADAERVATVHFAIDGTGDGQGVSADDVAELRRRFVETASAYAVPTGGVNTLIAPARRRHRRALAVSAALGTVAAVAIGAVAYGAVRYLPTASDTAQTPTASASPSATTVSVTWNPGPDIKTALTGFALPECGDTYAPAAQAVGGVTPRPSIDWESDPDTGTMAILQDAFTGESGAPGFVLAGSSTFVVTLDDAVVYAVQGDNTSAGGFGVNTPTVNAGGYGLSGVDLCTVDDAKATFQKRWGDFDWENATQDQLDAYSAAWRKFAKKHSALLAGTYKVYQISPLVFGEQAALGQVFFAEGLDLHSLSQDISWTDLADDPRVSPYCTGDPDLGTWECTPPPDVLREVLTRDVDPSSVIDTAPGLGISAPLVYEAGDPNDS